jgi:hypothetical protein
MLLFWAHEGFRVILEERQNGFLKTKAVPFLRLAVVPGWRSYGQDFWYGSCVESRCGAVGLGAAYLLPALSSAGASIASPCFRFHIPLIEPDVRISRFRLSEKVSRCRPREIARPLG